MTIFSDPHQTMVGLHDMLTGWQSIRARRRMRYSPPPPAASPSPPVSMHSPPVGAPPAPGPATVIAFRKLGDRIVPIFGDPAEFADATAHASANGAPNPSEARAAEAPAPPRAPPDASSEQRSQPTPPPPDFTPQAVEASAPRRSPAVPPTLDLPPPTPPSLVRADEQAVTLERVLADHRVQLAKQTEAQQTQHAAMMEAILAEHRRAQAQADHEHRQQLGELLAKHREEVQTVAQTTGEHSQALVDIREFLAEQARATQAEHARVGEKIESIVDMVGMVGETVHQIAAVALQPKQPQLGALPTRPNKRCDERHRPAHAGFAAAGRHRRAACTPGSAIAAAGHDRGGRGDRPAAGGAGGAPHGRAARRSAAADRHPCAPPLRHRCARPTRLRPGLVSPPYQRAVNLTRPARRRRADRHYLAPLVSPLRRPRS
jgi:hypothetical protein